MDTTTTTTGAITLGATSYGKSAVRLVKVTRHADRHDIHEINVAIALEGDFDACYVGGDNRAMLATDTMKNVVYALAKDHLGADIEAFGLTLVSHFLASAPTVSRVRVRIVDSPWERMAVGGQPHAHAFTRGAGERVATVTGSAGAVQVEAGIDNLLIIKTTNSGWEDFHRDEYTTLPDARDRILATNLTATWSYGAQTDVAFGRLWQSVRDQIFATFTDHDSPSVQHTLYLMGKAVLEAHPEVQKIHFTLPNKHHLLFNLAPFGLENNNEIFQVTSEPHGLIEGTVERRT